MKIAKRASAVSPSLTLEITAKAKKMKSEGLDVVSFGAGEPDFNTPKYVIDGAKRALDDGFTKYTPAAGTAELRAAVAKKLFAEHGLEYAPADIVISNGAKHALTNAFLAIVDEGDEVIIPSPYWLTYPELVKLAGGVPVIVETKKENGYKLTPEELKAAITDRTVAVLINSPVNPTGSVYSRSELEGLAKEIKKHDGLYVVSDEIYEKLIYTGEKQYSIAEYDADLKDRTVLINGVSKTYSMTGWRIGYTACGSALAKAISGIQSHMTSNPNSIAQYATRVALEGKEGEEFMREMLKVFTRRRKLICGLIEEAGLEYIRPDGAFYVMADVSRTFDGKKIKSAKDFAAELLDKKLVAVIPCESFGAGDYIRLSYAVSDADIEKGLRRIAEFVKN